MSHSASQRDLTPIRPGPAATKVHLSEKQLQALRACSKGISLRFEEWSTVNALLDAGFAEMNVAGVIRVTDGGHQYLRSQA